MYFLLCIVLCGCCVIVVGCRSSCLVCCLLFGVCCLLFVVRRSLCVVCYFVLDVCCVVWRLLLGVVGCWLLGVSCRCVLFVGCVLFVRCLVFVAL